MSYERPADLGADGTSRSAFPEPPRQAAARRHGLLTQRMALAALDVAHDLHRRLESARDGGDPGYARRAADAARDAMSYADFLENKRQLGGRHGFAPIWMPEFLFDFQRSLVEWATWKGRAALFCDCGMGKTPMQFVWAENVIRHTNKPVLVVAPLAASTQTVREAAKFGIEAERCSTGQHTDGARVIVTNYERLHLFDSTRYAGAVCDESSILKNFDGVTKAAVTEFLRLLPYRLLCTATAAPNDYIELGTSSEALGELGHMDMLSRFFKNDESSIAPLSQGAKWRFKPHAERPFWQWMCSWAGAARKPSDVIWQRSRTTACVLPALNERVVTVEASRPMAGHLFVTAARTLPEQREERRATIRERCEAVAIAAAPADKFVAWSSLDGEWKTCSNISSAARIR